MSYTITKEFTNILNGVGDLDYLLSTIAYSVAPTLKGQKPSNLITFSNNRRNLLGLWSKHKGEVIKTLGLNYYELYQNDERCVVLFYNAVMLNEYVFNNNNIIFLKEYGYSYRMDLLECLNQLKERFNYNCPHELGIFLGIPLEDVKGFIVNEGKRCLMCKYWKVYDNIKDAKCTFQTYDQVKMNMMESLIKGFRSNKNGHDILKLCV